MRRPKLRASALLAVLIVALAIPAGVLGQGQAGTTLKAWKTAEGYWIRDYAWSIGKQADVDSLTIPRGESRTVTFTIEATRGEPSETYGVRGEICVTNGGEQATANLTIVDVVQYKLPGPGQFQDLFEATVDTSAKPVLAPKESYCYPYDVQFRPVSGASYRNEARVTITNHSGHLGKPFGPEPKEDFSLPSMPTERDATATLTDTLDCPAGFTCTPGAAGPWPLTDSHTVSIAVTVTNDSACDTTATLANTATLTEDDSETEHTDSAEVTLVAPRCVTEPGGELEGCTLTQGYWKTHPGAWPKDYKPTDDFYSSGKKWIDVLWTAPSRGNAYYILAHQYIAAKLNLAASGDPTAPAEVQEALTWAEGFFTSKDPNARLPSDERAQALAYAATLDRFNKGEFDGWPHCDD